MDAGDCPNIEGLEEGGKYHSTVSEANIYTQGTTAEICQCMGQVVGRWGNVHSIR